MNFGKHKVHHTVTTLETGSDDFIFKKNLDVDDLILIFDSSTHNPLFKNLFISDQEGDYCCEEHTPSSMADNSMFEDIIQDISRDTSSEFLKPGEIITPEFLFGPTPDDTALLEASLQEAEDMNGFDDTPSSRLEVIPRGASNKPVQLPSTMCCVSVSSHEVTHKTRVETYSMHKPSNERVVNGVPLKRKRGRPRGSTKKSTIAKKPKTKRPRPTSIQIQALIASHGWPRSVSCNKDTVTCRSVVVQGKHKKHHKTWYRSFDNKKLREHLRLFHNFDLCVEEKACLIRKAESQELKVGNYLVCLHQDKCRKLFERHSNDSTCDAIPNVFENTPQGMLECIEHLRKAHGVVEVVHRSEVKVYGDQ